MHISNYAFYPRRNTSLLGVVLYFLQYAFCCYVLPLGGVCVCASLMLEIKSNCLVGEVGAEVDV